MKSSVENVSSVERKIQVEVEKERVLAELDDAYRQLGRKVKIEGFRPGRVPRHILERRFHSQVELEVMQTLVERTYRDVVKEQKLEVVDSPRVQEEPLKVGEPFRYQARVEVRPVIEPKDYTGISFKRAKRPVGDKEVEEELEKIRVMQSQLVPVADRDVAQKGDNAVIDFEALIDGNPFPGNKGESLAVEVKEGDFVSGFVPQVEGMKIGTDKTIDYTFPADYRIAEAAGKTAKITFKLKELKKRELPALDDELAKDVGGGNTLAELRTKIRENLDSTAKSEKRRETRTELFKALIDKNPFDCPRALIERAIDYALEDTVERMGRQGIDVRKLGLDLDRMRESFRKGAEEEVRGSLILEAIGKKENVSVSDEEFEARVAEIAKDNGLPLERAQQLFRRAEQKDNLIGRMREEKTIAFLESKANIEET
jgi:trigger factor